MSRQSRNPQETQKKILTAALDEFTASGYHGARVDSIVKAAEVNKRMIYHYFGDKEGLFRAVMKTELQKIKEVEESEPDGSLFDITHHWLIHSDKTQNYYRLYLSTETLIKNGDINLEDEHQDSFNYSLNLYTKLLQGTDIDPRYFLLAMVSITSMPTILPNMVEYITGKKNDNKTFQDEYTKVLKFLLCKSEDKV